MRARESRDPETVGPHRILARLGVGGMAIVYFGRSPSGRPVAVKVMHAELAGDAGLRERFRHEVHAVRLAGGRWSPGLVDADPEATPPWLVTEFLPAVSVAEAVRRFGPVRPEAAWTIAAALAEAVRSVHDAGILHLDLKPGNVLLTADGPRLIDFGVARTAQGGHGTAGSLGYMAPEQVAGEPVGPPADVFGFGATLAFLCTGNPPPPHDPAAGIRDRAVADIVVRCTDRDPTARPRVHQILERLAQRPDATPLPTDLVAAIDARAAEAANPPLPAAPHAPLVSPAAPAAHRRRALLFGLAGLSGATAIAAAAGATVFRPRSAARPAVVPAPGPSSASASASASASPSPSPKPRVLEFVLSGNATFDAVTYIVDDASTTVRNVRLPWSAKVDVAPLPRRTAWRLQFREVPGDYRYQVFIDGYRLDGATAGGASSQVIDVHGVD